ncbi:MAG: hypothetical protein JST11_28025 [Acidobacteria bacterium]|nr:hypothetical protein [Acidobacteriota bacterium]
MLQAQDGTEYYERLLKGAYLPALSGIVVSVSADGAVLFVAISDRTTPEIRLRVKPRITRTVLRGAEVVFRGVAATFAPEPFLLTMDVFAGDLTLR